MIKWIMLATVVAGGAVQAAPDTSIERGRYIVEQVGMCADCHTPRGPTGEPGAHLVGAPIGLTPKMPMPEWGDYAPRLAGGPVRFTRAELVTFLQTGVRPDGNRAAPPMPAYRMAPDDAEAVAAYLLSLPRN